MFENVVKWSGQNYSWEQFCRGVMDICRLTAITSPVPATVEMLDISEYYLKYTPLNFRFTISKNIQINGRYDNRCV